MTTGSLLIVDLLVAVLVAASWLGSGAAAALGQVRVAGLLLAGAVAATLLQVATVVALAAAGWWFAAEQVTLTIPLVGAAGGVAVALAVPALRRSRAPVPAVVALFTAGYAGVAKLAVTYLVGYPLTWGVALLAVALVAAGALVTWRAVAPSRSAARTRAAAGTVLLGAVGLLGIVGGGFGGFEGGEPVELGGGPAPEPVAAPLPVPQDPAPGRQVRRHTLTAQQATVTLASGRQVDAWTFNGQVPGPPITAVQGDLIEVTLRNADIQRGVTLHWHGYHVPSSMDGVPDLTQEPVEPGEEFIYQFRADQAGTYWYHTHSVSDVGVRMGLYGTLVVTPPEEDTTVDIVVPVHTFESVTVVGDHDRPWRQQVAPGTPVRLRLVNTDDTPRRFALAGTRYRLVAMDGQDLHQPGELAAVALRVPAGGRYDLSFTMPHTAVVLWAADLDAVHLSPTGDPAPVPPDTFGWPELDPLSYGEPAGVPFHAGSAFDRDFTLVLDRGLAMVDGAPTYAQTVNGRGFPNIPTQLVAGGDLVRFTIVNRSLETHPWHLHGHSVLVLSRDGEPPSGSPLWRDTFDVRPGEVWQVGFRADNPGLWMNHCHNLPHAHDGMMLHLAYAGIEHSHGG